MIAATSERPPSRNEMVAMVRAFQIRFGQSYNGPPRELPASMAKLRKDLIEEEAAELILAIDRGELPDMLDALCDLLYVTFGTANAMGFGDILDEAFARVHHSNMQKKLVERRDKSKRDSKWDIVKPEGWRPPVLKDLIEWDIAEKAP